MRYQLPYMDIELNLSNMTYILGLDSAEGKTYLFKLLQSVNQRPEVKGDILLQTYQDDLQISRLVKKPLSI